ncbi:MAG TPA: hypothetical protein VLI94_09555 [Solirubrobacterales bacterium]|nr:hypothetical protein [Solirubrobacterales bacterium]
MSFARFWEADWRLRLYTLSVPVFWILALGPGEGGMSGLEVDGEGAAISALLLIPLWSGSKWAVTLSALYSLWMTMAIGSIGLPPWGPMFGSLALLAGIQFLLLVTYDLGPNSRPESARRAPAVS